MRRRSIMSLPRRDAGFTLLEIMVVMLLIGILVTYASLSIGNRALDDRLEAEARRLEKLFQLASDEAQIQGRELGFRYTDLGYEFLVASADSGWTPYVDAGPLRPRAVEDPFFLELRIEGKLVEPVAIEKKADKDEFKREDDKPEPIEPQLLLLSSGEMSPFELEIKARNYASWFHLQGDAIGRLKLQREPQESKR